MEGASDPVFTSVDGATVAVPALDIATAPECLLATLTSRAWSASGGDSATSYPVHVSGRALHAARDLLVGGRPPPPELCPEMDYMCLGGTALGAPHGSLLLEAGALNLDGRLEHAVGALHAALCCSCSHGGGSGTTGGGGSDDTPAAAGGCDVSLRPLALRGVFAAVLTGAPAAVRDALVGAPEQGHPDASQHPGSPDQPISVAAAVYRGVRFLPREAAYEAYLPLSPPPPPPTRSGGGERPSSVRGHGGTRTLRGGLRVYHGETAPRGHEVQLGLFPTAEAAARAHDAALLAAAADDPFGAPAHEGAPPSLPLNFPPTGARGAAGGTSGDLLTGARAASHGNEADGPLMAIVADGSDDSQPAEGGDATSTAPPSTLEPPLTSGSHPGGPALLARLCVAVLGWAGVLQPRATHGVPEGCAHTAAAASPAPLPRWARERTAPDTRTQEGGIVPGAPAGLRLPARPACPPSLTSIPLASRLHEATRYTPLRGLARLGAVGSERLVVARCSLAPGPGGELSVPHLPAFSRPAPVAVVVLASGAEMLRRRVGGGGDPAHSAPLLAQVHATLRAVPTPAGEGGGPWEGTGGDSATLRLMGAGAASLAADPLAGRTCAVLHCVGTRFAVSVTGGVPWRPELDTLPRSLAASQAGAEAPLVSVLLAYPEGAGEGPVNLAEVRATHAHLTEVAAVL